MNKIFAVAALSAVIATNSVVCLGHNESRSVESAASGVQTQDAPEQTPSVGRIDRHYVVSPEMGKRMTIDVWVPEQYLEDEEMYCPVVYMHDGQNLFDATTTWNGQEWDVETVVSGLVEEGRIRPVIVVGVHSTQETRTSDLMPQKVFSSPEMIEEGKKYLTTPLRGDAYAHFVSVTLKRYIDSIYRTMAAAQNTTVMGSSMGGLMSLYMLCEYPDVFGQAACLSTHWIGDVAAYENGDEKFPEAMRDYVKSNIPRDTWHRIYFDRGTETLDRYYHKWDDTIINMIRTEGGYGPDRLSNYVDGGGAHDEISWQKRLWMPLTFLLRQKK